MGSADAKIKSCERQLRNPQDRRAINVPFTRAMSGQVGSRAVTQVGRSEPMTDVYQPPYCDHPISHQGRARHLPDRTVHSGQ